MLSSVSRRLSQTLGIERMAVLVASRREDGEGGFALAHAAGMAELSDSVRDQLFDLRFFEASLLSGGGKAYIFFENPRDGSGCPAALADAIAPLGLHYYVPCRARGRVVAYLGLGLTKNGEYLSSEDLSLAGTLSGSLAMALENARLYESLASKADEYQRLKEYSENIVESLSVGICTVGLDDRVESWNTQLELTFGISRAQAVGRELSALLPARLARELAGLRQESELRTIYKFPLAGADFPEEFQPAGSGNGAGAKESGGERQERVVNIAVAPLVAKDFKRIGRLIIFDDVTERIELEERLVQADKLSSVGLLAAGVAHEVNTPLAVISSYAQMLRRKAADDSGDAKLLEKITAQSFRASEIVNSLLNFSRLTRRKLSPLDLGEVLTETLSLVGPQFREAKIQVRTELDPSPVPVRGNAGKLQQVFLNLFLNARDAMPEGGTLTIETRYDHDGPGTVPGTSPGTAPGTARVTVSDTGGGMTAEQARKIFDPFFTTKGPKHGTGLGLAVTYGIIQEHSGNITVESRPGAGTSFRIELPLAAKPMHV
jgi:signal transduction histidine kinase